MEAARAGGGEQMDAASFDTNMNALYDNVLNDEEKAQWQERPPESLHLKASAATAWQRVSDPSRRA